MFSLPQLIFYPLVIKPNLSILITRICFHLHMLLSKTSKLNVIILIFVYAPLWFHSLSQNKEHDYWQRKFWYKNILCSMRSYLLVLIRKMVTRVADTHTITIRFEECSDGSTNLRIHDMHRCTICSIIIRNWIIACKI